MRFACSSARSVARVLHFIRAFDIHPHLQSYSAKWNSPQVPCRHPFQRIAQQHDWHHGTGLLFSSSIDGMVETSFALATHWKVSSKAFPNSRALVVVCLHLVTNGYFKVALCVGERWLRLQRQNLLSRRKFYPSQNVEVTLEAQYVTGETLIQICLFTL